MPRKQDKDTRKYFDEKYVKCGIKTWVIDWTPCSHFDVKAIRASAKNNTKAAMIIDNTVTFFKRTVTWRKRHGFELPDYYRE